MSNSSVSKDFIFVKSETIPEKIAKKAAWPAEGFEEVAYEAIGEEEEQWTEKEIKEQLRSTILSIQEKGLKDTEAAYVVLGVSTTTYSRKGETVNARKQVFDSNMLNVLKRLSAEVLAYLNFEHNKLLISCPFAKLIQALVKERYSKQYFQAVKRIGPLLFDEQVSEHLRLDSEWANIAKPLVIQLIPNISSSKKAEYTRKIAEHLRKLGIENLDCENPDFISINMMREPAEELLQTSNFVFRVSEVPEGLVESARLAKKRIRKRHD